MHFWAPVPLPLAASTPRPRQQECARALQHLEDTIAFEGPATIAAIILETDPRHRGHHGPAARLPRRASARSATGTASSSSWTRSWPGFGRTGKWFAADHFDVVPDLMTFAKGVNSGYVPLGGVAISAAIAETFATRPYPGGLTYSGHPLACAAAVATINVMAEEGIVENAARIGDDRPRPGPARARRAAPVASARCAASASSGRWSWYGTRRRASRWCRTTRRARPTPRWPRSRPPARRGGLWPFVNMNRTHVVPPCNVTEAEAKEGLAALDAALSVADEHTA